MNFVASEKGDECYKEIMAENIKVLALVDTGSTVSLLREDTFENMKAIKLSESKCKNVEFGGAKVETSGYFQAEVIIDDEPYNLDFHVVPVDSIPMQCIIDRNIIQLAEIIVDRNGTKINKYTHTFFLGNITLSEKNEIDVGPNHNVSVCEQAEYLLLRYKPMKTKSTEITLSITLKENKPIYSRPRRLPVPEREIVEMQVNEWVKSGIGAMLF